MIKRDVWEAAYRELIEDGRKRLGEFPSVETLLAYSRGDLDPEQTARIQEFLAYYPDLARALVAPFPSPEEIRPGDPDYLPDDILEQDWNAIQARLGGGPVVVAPLAAKSGKRLWSEIGAAFSNLFRGPRLAVAMSLALAVVFGFIAFRAELQIQRLSRELATPRINPEHRLLLPDGERDASGEETPIRLRSTADHYLLTPTLVHLPSYPDYRLRIFEISGHREKEIWRADGLRPEGNSFTVWMPHALLTSGDRHRLEIAGMRAGKPTLLATYTIELQD